MSTINHQSKNVFVYVGSNGKLGARMKDVQEWLLLDGLLNYVIHVDRHRSPLDCVVPNLTDGFCYLPTKPTPRETMQAVAACGLTEADAVLVYIATPTRFKFYYVMAILSHPSWRVIVEKPFPIVPEDVVTLEAVADGRLIVGNHYLWKKEMRDAVKEIDESALEQISLIEFDLLETSCIDNRDIDDAIFDLCWHGLACIIALFKKVGSPIVFEVTYVSDATYHDGSGYIPKESTAARIEGRLDCGKHSTRFIIRTGKGLSYESKNLALWTAKSDGSPKIYDLSETTYEAHLEMIRHVLAETTPGYGLGLSDAALIAQVCTNARNRAHKEPPYAFGVTPAFLSDSISIRYQ